MLSPPLRYRYEVTLVAVLCAAFAYADKAPVWAASAVAVSAAAAAAALLAVGNTAVGMLTSAAAAVAASRVLSHDLWARSEKAARAAPNGV
jgi:hypothetical protein